jgi:retron-type reverse transcriptase
MLMSRLAKRIEDKRVLKLIRAYLNGYFAPFRPVVSLDSGHPFRSIPAPPV